jgi:Deoxyribonuclease NucA/NucB
MPYPTLTFDYRRHRNLSDNIWHAQMAGHPKILTYSGPDLTLRRATRQAAMRFDHNGDEYEIPHFLSRDEYPFACTVEGGRASWAGHIPGGENSAQGGLIAAFLKSNRIVAGKGELSKFVVSVISHPNGPVTNICKPPCLPCKNDCKYTAKAGS